MQCQTHFKSGARTDRVQTRDYLRTQGEKLAKALRVNQIVGAECANETEPFIFFWVLEEAYIVGSDMDEYKYNWMGEVWEGDLVVKGVLCFRLSEFNHPWGRAEATKGRQQHLHQDRSCILLIC